MEESDSSRVTLSTCKNDWKFQFETNPTRILTRIALRSTRIDPTCGNLISSIAKRFEGFELGRMTNLTSSSPFTSLNRRVIVSANRRTSEPQNWKASSRRDFDWNHFSAIFLSWTVCSMNTVSSTPKARHYSFSQFSLQSLKIESEWVRSSRDFAEIISVAQNPSIRSRWSGEFSNWIQSTEPPISRTLLAVVAGY